MWTFQQLMGRRRLPQSSRRFPGKHDSPSTSAPPGQAADGEPKDDSPEVDGVSFSADLVLPILGVLVVLAAVIAVLCLSRKRSRSTGSSHPAPAPESGPPPEEGIYVRMEVLQGTYLGQTLDFTLSHELTVGRDPSCDIIFADGSVSRCHSRIFLANDTLYLEDLGSQNGTFVNGSRLEMACVLRSGDEIKVGDAAFRLKF